ncbi:MAG: aldehyde dehydrogenase EutE [Spirochaeta sp.]|jgi:acyl-CoA reductase-like NAD-dependent aldehyde dehydrogenase|nr:aldehyde dehydrogenase EutE [Spirochaeta sp.]
MLLQEKYLDQLVDKVVERLAEERRTGGPGSAGAVSTAPASSVGGLSTPPAPAGATEGLGVFTDINDAVTAALKAADELARFPLSRRGEIIGKMRTVILDNLEYLAVIARDETGMGRVEDKINKNRLVAEKTPGVEDLTTGAATGDRGITLDEYAPFGVIGSVIPSTNPTETVINNGIGMFAAGNAVVFNPHPNATRCSLAIMSMLNRVIIDNGGPQNCFVAIDHPTIETAGVVMNHPRIPFLAVTGSEGVVQAAMKTGKKVAAAGPGNPPAVVDETADIPKAAYDIVMGGSLDNGIICIAEKVTVVVDAVADRLITEMERNGGFLASANQARMLQNELFAEDPKPERHTPVKRQYVGRDARVLLEAVGISVSGDPRLVLVDVPPESPFAWTEMLMPVMPIVRVPDVDAAIDYAVRVERGNRHTASMHSKNIDKLTEMGRRINCSVYVKNGSTYSGLGMGGEGYTSFTIASPTGDGLTTARTFSRKRRCALVGNYGIV